MTVSADSRITARPDLVLDSSLGELLPGTRAQIVRVDGAGSDPAATRLTELGFTPGTTVEVVRRAPLRDPIVYRLKGYDVCLRRVQAACIRAVVVA
jgi:ferrous iron transport protein A